MKVIGIDPCLGGWFGVMVSEDCWKVNVFATIKDIINTWDDSDLFLVNLPIGLQQGSSEERKCDLEARKLLESFNSFDLPSVPCREAIYCSSFGVANIVNKRLTGRKISTRLWDVVDRIKELDEFLIKNTNFRDRFKECNSEIGYLVLHGKLMINSRTVLAGYSERRDVLRKIYPNTDNILEHSVKSFRRKDLKVENVLDALCIALHGYIGLESGFCKMPVQAEYDNNGLRMQIEFARYALFNYSECII